MRYIYDEPTSSPPVNNPTIITPSCFATVPSELLNNLQQAAIRIDMDRIDTLIDEIRSLNRASVFHVETRNYAFSQHFLILRAKFSLRKSLYR